MNIARLNKFGEKNKADVMFNTLSSNSQTSHLQWYQGRPQSPK